MTRKRDEEYRALIQGFEWDALLELWTSVKSGDTAGWDPGRAFEYLVLRAFELEGADVRWPYTVELGEQEIEQIDGAVYVGGMACLVESKDQAKPVNVEPIAKLRNQLLRRPAGTIGVVFSRRGFTRPARMLAQLTVPQAVLLWNGGEVDYALTRRCFSWAIRRKYRVLIEEVVPDFDITSESE